MTDTVKFYYGKLAGQWVYSDTIPIHYEVVDGKISNDELPNTIREWSLLVAEEITRILDEATDDNIEAITERIRKKINALHATVWGILRIEGVERTGEREIII